MGTGLEESWGRDRSQCSTESCGTDKNKPGSKAGASSSCSGFLIKEPASAKEVGVWAGLGVEWVLWPEGTVCEQSPRAGKVQK